MTKTTKSGMREIYLKTGIEVKNPFWDIEVIAVFTHKVRGIEQTIRGFYDGRDDQGMHMWKVRWMPETGGKWECRIETSPYLTEMTELNQIISLDVSDYEINARGYLRTCPNETWGLRFDNGDPFFLLGDTMYNIFGACYCGVDVETILRHRKAQGVNYIRARMQISPYLPGLMNSWQTRECWAWGGSPQWPDFTRFNLDYFRAVDKVISMAEDLNIGMELIFEAWLVEFPFNDRNRFTTEYEELWIQYILSRYAAHPAVYIWCPANEYEFYPVGEVKYNTVADRWFKRLAKFIKTNDPYGHPIGVHNWEQKVPLSDRLGNDENIDVYLVQSDWANDLSKDIDYNGLCMGIERQIHHHSPQRDKVIICDEFGYESTNGVETFPGHALLNHNHTRRGQWRCGFAGYPVVHGFNNTWGPHIQIEPDAVGAGCMIHYFRFMTEDIRFYEMHPSLELIVLADGSEDAGTFPQCLSNEDKTVMAVYFPATGECELKLNDKSIYSIQWINPRNGEITEFEPITSNVFKTPKTCQGGESWGDDWVLLLKDNRLMVDDTRN